MRLPSEAPNSPDDVELDIKSDPDVCDPKEIFESYAVPRQREALTNLAKVWGRTKHWQARQELGLAATQLEFEARQVGELDLGNDPWLAAAFTLDLVEKCQECLDTIAKHSLNVPED